MPVYEYLCTDCGPVERVCAIADRERPVECQGCGSRLQRLIATPPQLGSTRRTALQASARNERSQHQPGLASQRESHPAGCGCCGGSRAGTRSSTRTGADGSKAFPSARPWMISH